MIGLIAYKVFIWVYHVIWVLGVERADAIARQADVVAAITLEVLKGTTKAFESGMLNDSVFAINIIFNKKLSVALITTNTNIWLPRCIEQIHVINI